MKEFGSDFHYFGIGRNGRNVFDESQVNFYADGRHAMQHLIHYKLKSREWKRLWMPEYFCYEVIRAIEETGVKIVFYHDTPLNNDIEIIRSIPFRKGDVLFRMNYFGTRGFRDNREIPVEVIEDHSHDLISEWALNSNADWCVASLRKTLPLPEGGILWSPLRRKLPDKLPSSMKNEIVSYKKLSAMLLKKLYLETLYEGKDDFRQIYMEAEKELSCLAVSGISDIVQRMLERLNIEVLYQVKRENWNRIREGLDEKLSYLRVNTSEGQTPFSFVLKFDNKEVRDLIRDQLVKLDVYPAVLWEIPTGHSPQVETCAGKLLSIHCDARYSSADIDELLRRINSLF